MWCYPKIWGIKTGRPNRLSYALPPLDVASSMLRESVYQKLSKLRGCVIKFSAFLWGYIFVIWRFTFTTDMPDFKEQRTCIKFCFNLKKTAAETQWMLQKAFKDNVMRKRKLFCGTNASRTDKRLLTTMRVLDECQQAHNRKRYEKFTRLSLQIVGQLSTMFVR
jgi:hypothetical protein